MSTQLVDALVFFELTAATEPPRGGTQVAGNEGPFPTGRKDSEWVISSLPLLTGVLEESEDLNNGE